MKKEIIRIELKGKIIASKPFFFNDTLKTLRAQLKEKIEEEFIFLDKDGNKVDKEDENDYLLKDIENEKIIRISNDEGKKKPELKIFLNNKKKNSIICNFDESIYNLRELLKDKICENFIFLDKNGNPVDKEDEKDYNINDILNINNSIKLINENFKKIDLSKYEIIEKKENLIFYKYSSLERQPSNHPLVYQYFYDKFDINDYEKAYVILFCGKTGDGKTTAINAFFNIIKGIQLEDNYRFILITEPKKSKGQTQTQTDGVHLYYLKDYNNQPILIIDSPGCGDTRGKHYDEMVNEAFNYVFSDIIYYINIICFISKSNTNRLDELTKYTFNTVINLFSEDIYGNLIILTTFASKNTIKEGPAFVEIIQNDEDFLKIKSRMDVKWWYAFDSKCILDNEIDELSNYSFSQLNELYEEKIKKIRPKSVKKCAKILQSKKQLKIQFNNLRYPFEDLLIEKTNLNEKEKVLNEISNKIKDMEEIIRIFDNESKNLNHQQIKVLNELNYKKNKLLEVKDIESKNKEEIQKKVKNITHQIIYFIFRMRIIYENLNNI